MLADATPADGSSGGSAPEPQVLDRYCSPSGDYCTGIVERRGQIKLVLSASFGGEYEICVRSPDRKRCRDSRLKPTGGPYLNAVDWRRRFADDGPGRYKVVWRMFGEKLGETLSFRLRVTPLRAASRRGGECRSLCSLGLSREHKTSTSLTARETPTTGRPLGRPSQSPTVAVRVEGRRVHESPLLWRCSE